ncbi:UDP-glucuronic acid decarboxylase 1 [Fusarium beomiforme]|uniref:UDP-glucuronic acid decarboxylase 1 n=1 Tax=Fusarium beomiforme TaxID=44412 RepID=A0A9P5AMY7_9HYPO|nr:UDP-glucuronic acid decarboxylase 1 [Fusarium beomiforme]
MVIIVTGGAGFLGCNLIQLLLEKNHQVVIIDSLWTGSQSTLDNFRSDKRVRYIQHDVRDPLPWIDGVEQIYHLACPASPVHFETQPIDILQTCFNGASNVLDYALKHNARVLLASTSEVYGDSQIACQREDYRGNVNCFGPRACYDEGKRVMEALGYAYQAEHGLEVRIARIFNAYGPFMTPEDGRAVPNFIMAALKREPITIYGDGHATRCFQHANDCVRGLEALMNSDYQGPVNIGSDLEIEISEIADIISRVVAEKTGYEDPIAVQLLPKREDDPTRRKPDISLAERVLGWKPRVSLEEGVATTVDWFIQRENGISSEVLIVGGGFGGIYLFHTLRQNGSKCKILEAGSDIGGTWHHNRYPEARVDINDPLYQFSVPEVWAVKLDMVRKIPVSRRTPNLCLLMRQRALSPEEQVAARAHLPRVFKHRLATNCGYADDFANRTVFDDGPEQRETFFKSLWSEGGFKFWIANYKDVLTDEKANRSAYDFWTRKTRLRIPDAQKRDILAPVEPPHPWGGRRPCLETDYYEQVSKKHVSIIDVRKTPTVEFEKHGLKTSDGRVHECDIVCFATGFDALTGGMEGMGLVSTEGISLSEKWANGVSTYLGLSMAGYPNMFHLFAAHGPTASNGPSCIELQADWVVKAMVKMREQRH